MPKEYLDYIDKKMAEKKGLERLPDGRYFSGHTLERYEAKGYLDGGKYDSSRLLDAGMKLYVSYIKKGGDGVKAVDTTKIRVDGGGAWESSSEIKEENQRKYDKAMASVPREFWDVTRSVCCDDKDLIGEIDNNSKRQRQYQKGAILLLLKMGLARLVEHYGD